MNIPPLQNEALKVQTLDGYIYGELHRIFTHAAEVLAADIDDPETVAAIPAWAFRAENYMRHAWDTFVEIRQADHDLAAGQTGAQA